MRKDPSLPGSFLASLISQNALGTQVGIQQAIPVQYTLLHSSDSIFYAMQYAVCSMFYVVCGMWYVVCTIQPRMDWKSQSLRPRSPSTFLSGIRISSSFEICSGFVHSRLADVKDGSQSVTWCNYGKRRVGDQGQGCDPKRLKMGRLSGAVLASYDKLRQWLVGRITTRLVLTTATLAQG